MTLAKVFPVHDHQKFTEIQKKKLNNKKCKKKRFKFSEVVFCVYLKNFLWPFSIFRYLSSMRV